MPLFFVRREFRTAAKHAGKRTKCPKCGGVIQAPAEQRTDVPVHTPSGAPAGEQGPSPTPIGEVTCACPNCGLSIPPDQSLCPACGCDVALAAVVTANIGNSNTVDLLQSKSLFRLQGRKSSAIVRILMGAVAGAALAAVAVMEILSAKYLTAGPEQTPQATLVLAWPPEDRSFGAGRLDGHKLAVPEKGDLEYSLEPGEHHLALTREGYEPIQLPVTIKEGERYRCPLTWTLARAAEKPEKPNRPGKSNAEALPPETGSKLMSFDDWLQDPESAKKKAAAEGKNLLLAFLGSDRFSISLTYEALLQEDFARVRGRYVLVWIDGLMGNSRLQTKVQDAARNRRVIKQFRVRRVPTLIVADAQGMPFGVIEGPEDVSVDAVLAQLNRPENARVERDRLFREIEASPGGKKLPAIEKALRFLAEWKLVAYYGPMLDQWLAIARQYDPRNEQGVNEVLFQIHWMLAYAEIDPKHPDAQLTARPIADLETWKKTCRFKDADRAAQMHLMAAKLLFASRRSSDALKSLEEGLAYQPSDPVLREQIAAAMAEIRGVGVGTGFLVAPGVVLTNYHVIDGPAKILVKIPNGPDPLPARIVAQDAERDVALLKIDVPDELDLTPLVLSTRAMSRGVEVSAFGYPGNGTGDRRLKLTKGIISATADESTGGMMLLGLIVNPGNSGGPLCDRSGEVVGIVAAKSPGGPGVDSYGMAIPAQVLRSFLNEHLPGYAKRPGPRKGETPRKPDKSRRPKPVPRKDKPPLDWVEIDKLVSPSVMMIVRAPR